MADEEYFVIDRAYLVAQAREAWRNYFRPLPYVLPFAILAAIFLSGCTTTRYITVPCISKDQMLPAEPPKVADKLTGRADEDVKILGGSAVRLRAWGQGLHGILEGCRG